MKKIWQANGENNTYHNPILYADYSDPDVVRVGDKYYMTASSFNCLPGLPILVSEDLVNWELINYAVKSLPYEVYDKPAHAKGIWAPSLRYHEGKFWIYFGMPDEGIFMTCTENPYGDWEPLVCVKACKGWIDPCPFWDEDGNAYLVHAFAKSRVGFNGVLDIVKMNPDGKSFLDEGVRVIEVDPAHRTIEGPKFYKRNGYYYIFAPAGGVPQGWQLAMRSKNIYGPYEKKVVLHQGNSPINGPHQGGLVDTPNGEEWFIHFQDAKVYGRITHLQPVRWVDDWPVMGVDTNGDGIGEPVLNYPKPTTANACEAVEPPTTDYFESESLGLQWQWYANPQEAFYSLKERLGYLRLFALPMENKLHLWETPQLLTQKLPCPKLRAEAEGDFSQLQEGDLSGLLVIGKQYAYIGVEQKTGFKQLVYKKSVENEGEQVIASLSLEQENIYLKVEIAQGGQCKFGYGLENGFEHFFEETFMAEDSTWMGARVGLFAVNHEAARQTGFADYKAFIVTTA